jgi:GLPGLI family protein
MFKNMKRILTVILFFLAVTSANSQVRFVSSGKIEFERKINVHRQFEPSEDDSWFKEFVSKLPKFNTTYFDLYFTEGKTIYKPGRETDDNKQRFWGIGPSKDNIVYTELERKSVKSLKNVFEQTFLLQDSVKQLEWRMTDEIRTIAGFDCRKAVARICDSVYVVAFYTEEITVSGGPESFYGLPGMILGLAVPRLYTTWFATKVELVPPTEKDFAISSKGKKVTNTELLKTLQSSLSDWGKHAQRNIWWVML